MRFKILKETIKKLIVRQYVGADDHIGLKINNLTKTLMPSFIK